MIPKPMFNIESVLQVQAVIYPTVHKDRFTGSAFGYAVRFHQIFSKSVHTTIDWKDDDGIRILFTSRERAVEAVKQTLQDFTDDRNKWLVFRQGGSTILKSG